MTQPPAVPLPYDRAAIVAQLGSEWETHLTAAYRWMIFARTLDSRMLALQRQGRIGFYGPATGQEAVSVAAGLVARSEDWIFPGLREQLVALIRGHSLSVYLDHLFANDQDPARGRQMPCHPTAREVHYVSMSSVIGTQISQAVGAAYAMKHRHDPAVSFAFFGDGATSSNDFHAGLNFAGTMALPVLFCCTNNQWAISVPVEHQSRVAQLADKAAAYGMPGHRIDGTDFVAAFAALRDAAGRVRSGAGPEMLEFLLFRMTPHSSSDDPKRYQAADWMARAEANDPVRRLEALLDQLGVQDAASRAEVARMAEAQVKEATEKAEAVRPPVPDSMTEDVFAPLPSPTRGGG
ncbi:MAG: thiamine pyrophosphate-dependent enzyme [Thermoplasmata archaeon]|nr:thiamine pyrophosphate-dependent enzyme [Thermoplasmata archaeon]